MDLMKSLLEAKMSPARMLKTISDDILLGYEIEMFVPEHSSVCQIDYKEGEGDISDNDGEWDEDTDPSELIDDASSFFSTALLVRNSLERTVGFKPEILESPHEVTSSWKIVRDSSITGDGSIGIGVELCTPSPPMGAKESLAHLKKIFDWMESKDIETNQTTGFHLNISFKNMIEKLDWVKLVMFLGENKILTDFNREGNRHALPASQDLIDKIGKLVSSGKRGLDELQPVLANSSEMQAWAKKTLTAEKYRTINFGKAAQGYLEFRAAGGEGYHREYQLIEETVGRIVTALQIACDPNIYKEEYLKKLSSLILKAKTGKNVEPLDITFTQFLKAITAATRIPYDFDSGYSSFFEKQIYSQGWSMIANQVTWLLELMRNWAIAQKRKNLMIASYKFPLAYKRILDKMIEKSIDLIEQGAEEEIKRNHGNTSYLEIASKGIRNIQKQYEELKAIVL